MWLPLVGCLLLGKFCIASLAAKDLASGREHLQRGRYAEAIALAEKLPASVDADLIVIRALHAEGQWEQVDQQFERMLKRHPQDARARAEQAEWLHFRGQLRKAEQAARRAIADDPQQPLAHLILGYVLRDTARLELADQEFHWLVRYYNSQQPTEPEVLRPVALGAAEYARWHASAQILDFVVNQLCPDVLEIDKSAWWAHQLAGALLVEKYNRAQGVPELRRALVINPRSAETMTILGEAAWDDSKYEEARDWAVRALDVNPTLPGACILRGGIELQTGDYVAAARWAGKALAVNPHDARANALLAMAALVRDGVPTAGEMTILLDRAATTEPRTTDGEAPAADRAFETILTDVFAQNSKPGAFLTDLGVRLSEILRSESAEVVLGRASELMPQIARANVELGVLAFQRGDLGAARQRLDAAFKADPFHVRVSNLRRVLSVLEKYGTHRSDHFLIRFDESSATSDLIEDLSGHLEQCYSELTHELGFSPPDMTQVEIYSDNGGIDAHQWFSARMTGQPWIQTIGASTGHIIALTAPSDSPTEYDWRRVTRHELVHVITLQQSDFQLPRWFAEGIAVYFEGGEWQQDWARLLKERVPRGEIPSFDRLSADLMRPQSSDDWSYAYSISGLFSRFLVEEFGDDALRQMIAGYTRGKSTSDTLTAVCNMTQPQVEQQFRGWLEELVLELAPANQ